MRKRYEEGGGGWQKQEKEAMNFAFERKEKRVEDVMLKILRFEDFHCF
jgi:hypothetical protein